LCCDENLTKDLTGKNYLITGTLSGHMEALAAQLAHQGTGCCRIFNFPQPEAS